MIIVTEKTKKALENAETKDEWIAVYAASIQNKSIISLARKDGKPINEPVKIQNSSSSGRHYSGYDFYEGFYEGRLLGIRENLNNTDRLWETASGFLSGDYDGNSLAFHSKRRRGERIRSLDEKIRMGIRVPPIMPFENSIFPGPTVPYKRTIPWGFIPATLPIGGK